MTTSNANQAGVSEHSELTVDHVLDCLLILLAQVDQTGLSFAELVATGSIEESGP
jgi:hypothetical protein